MFTMKGRHFILVIVLLLALPATVLALAKPQAGAYVVTDNGNAADIDPGDGLCLTAAAVCTLRAAIQEANVDSIASVITFVAPMEINYPGLPDLTEDGTTIDASNQWEGTWPNGEPGVSMGGDAILLAIKSDNNVVRGIEFHGGDYVGIEITTGSLNTIGGTDAGERNVFFGGTGVNIQGSGTGNIVKGNYFGTRDGLTLIASATGVTIHATENTIENNLVAGHRNAGILIWGGVSNMVDDNVIGVDRLQQSALPNAIGVLINGSDYNLVENNHIAGNTGHGVELRHADHTELFNNTIGDPLYAGNGGNGIHAHDANDNHFGGSLAGNRIHMNDGVGIWLHGNNNVIQGSGVGGNGLDGIHVDGGQRNQIGGASEALGNSIGDNGGNGIYLSGTAISTTIQSNIIGLSSGAFDGGNGGHGIFLNDGASANHIGGLGTGEGNWIAWNDLSGIYMTGANTQGNVVEGNIIGAPVNWSWEAPNGHHGIGIYDGAHDNWIGWNNTIVSSNWSGVAIVNSDDNVVWFNQIGTNSDGGQWGNSYYGVHLFNSAGNAIFGNAIAYNGAASSQAGVRVEGGLAGNPINTNSIHDNVGAGIELVNGGNFELGAPTLTGASCQAQPGDEGQVQGVSCPDCTIEIFSDTADEGRIYEGTTTAAANSGEFTWNGAINGPHITATATTVTGATSAFSAPLTIGPCLVPGVFLPFITK